MPTSEQNKKNAEEAIKSLDAILLSLKSLPKDQRAALLRGGPCVGLNPNPDPRALRLMRLKGRMYQSQAK